MIPAPRTPTVRELIAEYATIEDRVRATWRPASTAAHTRQTPELLKLAERERRVLAMLLRRHRSANESGCSPEVAGSP